MVNDDPDDRSDGEAQGASADPSVASSAEGTDREFSSMVDAIADSVADSVAAETSGNEASPAPEGEVESVAEVAEPATPAKPRRKRAAGKKAKKTKAARGKRGSRAKASTAAEPVTEAASEGSAMSATDSMSAESTASDGADGSAFPFVGGGDVPDLSPSDESIAELVNHDDMQNAAHDDVVAAAAAEAVAAAREESALLHAANVSTSESPIAETAPAASPSVEPDSSPTPTWRSRITRLLGAGGARNAIARTAAAAGLAVAAGFGYGLASKYLFGDGAVGLSQEIAESPAVVADGDVATEKVLPQDGEATQPPAAEAATPSAPAGENAQPNGAHVDGDGTVKDPSGSNVGAESASESEVAGAGESHGADHAPEVAEPKVEVRVVGPEIPFEMPALASAVPGESHPLARGRQRLDEGDLEAARRIAADFLLREDGLSASERLLVPQAYALLADSLKVEWQRARIAATKQPTGRGASGDRPRLAGEEQP